MAQVTASEYNEFKVEKLMQFPEVYSCANYRLETGTGELIFRNKQEVVASMFRQDIDGDIRYFFFIYG